MAIIKTGFLSPFKNKLGNGVGRRWRNLNIVAEYNGSPRNPRTTAQQIQRTIFAVLSELARSFKSTLNDALGGVCAGTKTFPRAKFISLNKGTVTSSNPGSAVVAYSDMVIARGGMTSVQFGAPDYDTPQTVECSFSDGAFKAAYPTANMSNVKVRLVAYSPDAKLAVFSDTVGTTDPATLVVPTYWNGMKVHVFGYTRWDGDDMPEYGLKKGDVSDSMYLGNGTIG